VAAHFAGKPVVVLGMNVDTKAADAHFVVDKLTSSDKTQFL
jgi:hypothetical protein